jgi:hypothetical protein
MLAPPERRSPAADGNPGEAQSKTDRAKSSYSNSDTDVKSFTSRKLEWLTHVSAHALVKPLEFEVAFVVAQHINATTGKAYLSEDVIGEYIDADPRTLRRARKRLKELGWITWSRTGTANAYALLYGNIAGVADDIAQRRAGRLKRRLADEYDAAQERGEVRGHGNKSDISKENITRATVADIGLTSKEIHEARIIRDADDRSSASDLENEDRTSVSADRKSMSADRTSVSADRTPVSTIHLSSTPSDTPLFTPLLGSPVPSEGGIEPPRKKKAGNGTRKGRRVRVKIDLPEDWVLSDEQWTFGAKLGLTGDQIEAAQRKLKRWVKDQGKRSENWDSFIANWLERELTYVRKSGGRGTTIDDRSGFDDFLNGADRHGQ